MAIDLPTLPRGATVNLRLLSFNARLTPPLGGAVQTVARLGGRFAVAVSLPSLAAACGAQWLAARLRAETELATLRLAWPQASLGVTGNAAVSGAGQAGATLTVASSAPALPAGAFFSFAAGGRSYLHALTQAKAAGGGGLAIAPMLRVSPADGAVLNFLAPVVEGDADPGVDWEVQLRRYTTLAFTLTERA